MPPKISDFARTLNYNLDMGGNGYDSLPASFMVADIVERDLRHMEYATLKTAADFTTDFIYEVEGWEIVFNTVNHVNNNGNYFIRDDIGSSLMVSFYGKSVYIHIAGASAKDARQSMDVAKKVFPTGIVERNADAVPLVFWSLGPRGAVSREKKIQPLMWEDIRRNYKENTVEQIERLRNVQPPMDGGRLILAHGIPGLGKSSAIRHLVYHWLPWADTSYVVDPEKFFGSADYMLSVLLDTPSNDLWYKEDEEEIEDVFTLQGKDRWNLLIVEDADEFLRNDAKDRTGQALSRLLNLTDGLIGQGLNFLVLITTNEKISNIHEAVSREGRCMANIEFEPFNKAEAATWLGEFADEIKNDPAGTMYSLAKLYDFKRERAQIKAEIDKDFRVGTYI